jgi:hypothetical protein
MICRTVWENSFVMTAILEKHPKEVSPQAEPVSDGDVTAVESDIIVDWDHKEEARIRRK